MVTKYLNNFYTYKAVPAAFRLSQLRPGDEEATLERQVQAWLARGHQSFFQGRYPDALDAYQTAYGLVHRFLHPDFPIHVVRIAPGLVQGLKVLDSLLAAAAEVARLRPIAGTLPVVAPGGPSPEILKVVADLGRVGSGDPPSPARNYYHLATTYLQVGAVKQAQAFLDSAREANGGRDRRLEADIQTAVGAALLPHNTGRAREAFTQAHQLYQELRLPGEAAAVSNNLGVLHSLEGNAAAAGAAFQAAGDLLPRGFGRALHQSLNPGTASTMVRPMGSAGLGLLLRGAGGDSDWVTVAATAPESVGAERMGVFVADKVVPLKLTGDVVAEFKQRIYEPRRAATTLEALGLHEDLPFNFVAYLGHVYGFTLPLSIGDCHYEMGEYEKALGWYQFARDYPYLNQAVEAPTVWLKMANAFLAWGHAFYKAGNKAEARTRYQSIIRLQPPVLDPASPLYTAPVFNDMKAKVEALLAALQPPDPEVHNPAIAVVVLLAKLNLENLTAGIDLPLLSLDREEVPVFTFEYLQNVARYFAEHAIQAERTYINFKTSAEKEEFTRSMLENAVQLEQANEQLEAKKVEVAQAQKAAIDANLNYADVQLQNAKALKAEYANVSLQEIALDSEITYVGAPTTEYEFSGYGEYGISDGTHRADEVLRTLTRRRREISREFELHNMDRRIAELTAARDVAQKQQAIALAQVQAANLQKNIATLRRQQAQQQLALFDSREFTPDLWNRLANEIKSISQSYLDQALIIARLMEQSFEFEVGDAVDVIKPSYTRNDLSGLLAGDFLLRDIDSFTFLRIILTQKKQPMKEIISLADRFPLQFLREFQRSGRMHFRTELADFDRNYPGSYQPRIKRVEINVEGLVGREGVHGTLTNTGQCLTRLRDGSVKMRLLKPETLLLSRYRIGPDGVVFTPDREMLAIFENSPVSTSWILEFRPAANDLVYPFLTDVKLVLYYESFYDEALRGPVLEELAEGQPLTGRRTVALRYELFDEFFTFQDTGEVRFTLRDTMLPFYHTQPRIRELTILVQTDEGVDPAALNVRVRLADGADVLQTTDAEGAISTGGTNLDSLVGRPWLQEWIVSIPEADNQPRFTAGFRWSQVRNLVVVTEYEFTPRRLEGEPFVRLRDNFTADPLPAFDVADDPQADVGGPSQWVHQAAAGRLEQHAAIRGGAMDNTPAKPGAYLVRKITPALPAIKDLIVTCTARSTTGGGIGLVFRWQDVNNFYFFLMDSQRGYRRLGKKVGGVFAELATPAADLSQGYTVNQNYTLKARAAGGSLRAYLDGQLVLSGQDASLPNAGRVGFFCWNDTGAEFDDFQIIEL